jgi:hypothetical protein
MVFFPEFLDIIIPLIRRDSEFVGHCDYSLIMARVARLKRFEEASVISVEYFAHPIMIKEVQTTSAGARQTYLSGFIEAYVPHGASPKSSGVIRILQDGRHLGMELAAIVSKNRS